MTLFGAMRLPRSVLFGRGQRRAIGSVAAGVGVRALICTDARLGADPELARIADDLQRAGVKTAVYDETRPDLPVGAIADCVQGARGFSPDLVIGLGGGSCMDLAKVVALLVRHGGRLDEYYGEFMVPGPVLPVVAVPTTSGTGSEVSPVAVVSDAERGLKVGTSSPYLIPQVAVCDPDLTLTCPPRLTASAGVDALTHAVESFTAFARPYDPMTTQKHVFVGKNAMSDHFAKLALAEIWNSLRRACCNGSDTEAREHLMLGALMAGCAFGVSGASAAHTIQYPVGALTHTAHGDGVGTLLPYVMQYNRPACAPAFAELARTVGLGSGDEDSDALAQAFVDGVAGLLTDVGIPGSLQELGLNAEDLDAVAEGSLSAARLITNNPRPLDLGSLQRIVQAAYVGDRTALADA